MFDCICEREYCCIISLQFEPTSNLPLTNRSSYANPPFCCTSSPVTENTSPQTGKVSSYCVNTTSPVIPLHKHVVSCLCLTFKAVRPKNNSCSYKLAISASTGGGHHGGGHNRENVFETPILISSHSGSRAPAEKRQKVPSEERKRPIGGELSQWPQPMQQTFNFRCKLPNYDGCGDDAHDDPDHPARRVCALRALGLLLAVGAPTVGWGKTF